MQLLGMCQFLYKAYEHDWFLKLSLMIYLPMSCFSLPSRNHAPTVTLKWWYTAGHALRLDASPRCIGVTQQPSAGFVTKYCRNDVTWHECDCVCYFLLIRLLIALYSWLFNLMPTAQFTLASFGDFCRFKLHSTSVILSHGVSDFGLVILVDFFLVISDLGRHRDVRTAHTFACGRRSAEFLTDSESVAREKLQTRTDAVHFSSISCFLMTAKRH